MLAAGTKHPAFSSEVHRALKHVISRARPWDRAQREIITDPRPTDERCIDITAGHSTLSKQRPDVRTARESEQQMLGLNHQPAKHPRLILRQPNQIVRLVGERTQRGTAALAVRQAEGPPDRRRWDLAT